MMDATRYIHDDAVVREVVVGIGNGTAEVVGAERTASQQTLFLRRRYDWISRLERLSTSSPRR
jgi:hypothetical protein